MNTKPEDLVPKIARNELFFFIARASMLFATVIGLPAAGFMLSRIINEADALTLSVTQQNVEIRVLSATLKDRLDQDGKELTDHELRLRSLERR